MKMEWNELGKIQQIEVDRQYFYVTYTQEEQHPHEPTEYVGIDRNAAGHVIGSSTSKWKGLKASQERTTHSSKV